VARLTGGARRWSAPSPTPRRCSWQCRSVSFLRPPGRPWLPRPPTASSPLSAPPTVPLWRLSTTPRSSAPTRSPLPRAAVETFLSIYSRHSITWADLAWLRSRTRLPVVLKGVLHPDDARRAVDEGADGIVVSTHGGRQVDRSVAALDALPDVVAAVEADVSLCVTVLRLANDEVVQDFGRAIEKIRDLVRLRRSQMNQEG